jgi:cobalt-zinc-cadmium efflux system outer membrane protein
MESPALASQAWSIRAAEARTLQAGLLPNPELSFDTNQMGGTGAFRGLQAAQATITLSRTILLAGKRHKRVRLRSLESNLAGWDYEARRLDVITRAYTAFLGTLANQERLELAGELLRIAEDALIAVTARVKAGKVSPLDQAKAEILRSTAAITHKRAMRTLEASRKVLASTWGARSADFQGVTGDIYEISPIPRYQSVTKRVNQNPDIARWVTELEQRRAALRLEQARRTPNLSLMGGVQRLRDVGQNTFVLGFSIPLPFSNRNQGGIREAKALLSQADEEKRFAQATVAQQLAAAYGSLLANYQEAELLRDTVLPRAEQAYQAARDGYNQGKFNYLDALDAQRTLFEARGQYINSLAGYHTNVATVERLIGEPLGTTSFSVKAQKDNTSPAKEASLLTPPASTSKASKVSRASPPRKPPLVSEKLDMEQGIAPSQAYGAPALTSSAKRYQDALRAARGILDQALRQEANAPQNSKGMN